MVNRLQGRQIVIVDLDGTLVNCNTFHEFIKINFKYSKILVKLKFIYIFLLRIFRIISHSEMKFKILEYVTLNEVIINEFKKKINKKKNKNVNNILMSYRKKGIKIWLATAAPSLYIPYIWDGKFFSTRSESNKEKIECRGINKVNEIKKYLKKEDRIVAVFTDHYDDIPLLQLSADKCYLVNPNKITIRKIRKQNLTFELVN